jgi:signal transduction histidine kinase
MRRQLTLLVASTTMLVLIAFLVPLAVLVKQITEDRALSRAAVVVQAIVPLIGTSDENAIRLAVTSQPVPVTVFLPGGPVLGTTAERTPAVRLAEARGRSLTVANDDGDREIVVPVVSGGQTTVVRTVVTAEELTRGVTQAWLVLAALGIALVLLGLLVAGRLARTIVAPISTLAAVSQLLGRAHFDARTNPGIGPPEVREVARALNQLAGRIQGLLREEREQVADLSHRLRTPLTALRLEAESLRDPQDAARIAAAADSIERSVTAVIQQARRRGAERPAPGCDVTAVVADRVAFWTVLAEDTDRAVRRHLPETPIPVAVPADDLAAALDALLGNVFAHTPDGTALSVTLVARLGGGATLTVADSGPGFGSHTGVLRRGESGGGSTGLGMDIARRAAEAGGGSLHLGAGADGGAEVRLELAAERGQ